MTTALVVALALFLLLFVVGIIRSWWSPLGGIFGLGLIVAIFLGARAAYPYAEHYAHVVWDLGDRHPYDDDEPKTVQADPSPTAAKPTETTAPTAPATKPTVAATAPAPSPTPLTASSGSLDTSGGGTTESPDGISQGVTIPAGSAGVFRVISAWPTDTTPGKAMVCYTNATTGEVTVGTQQNGYVLDAWSTPSFHPWSWIARDAQDEVSRIKSGSLGKGKWEVQGPMECS